jgi:hypothetical protein
MITNYLSHLRDMPAYCREFGLWVIKQFFTTVQSGISKESETPVGTWYYYGHYCYHPEYQQRLETIKRCVEICHVFGIADLMLLQPELKKRVHRLGEPEIVKNRKEFEDNLNFVANTFRDKGFPIASITSQLQPTETLRLVEAIHCLFEGCLHSSVAMAASAIEFRLLDFMKRISPSSSKELEQKPLGSLIQNCLSDPAYSAKLPERHRPLLQLCNEYRVFSVHPKMEHINQNEAIAVISLAFSFILDKRLTKVAD